jgi:hypothetical protein
MKKKHKIRYSTNYMGILNNQWYIDRGLTQKRTIVFTEDSLMVKYGKQKPGDTLEVDEPTEYYSCGRLDFWNPYSDSHYPDEMGVPPMRAEDWNSLSDWLDTFETDKVMTLQEIVTEYEKTNPKIRFWVDVQGEKMKEIYDDYEKFEKLMETKYPKILQDGYGGFCIGKGWYQIVDSLCNQIQNYINWHKSDEQVVPQVVVEQIKEKFGGLRFYYRGGDEKIDGMVRMAEEWAEHTCEECGKPGHERSGSWIKTLCDEHHEERQKRYEK